MAQKEYFQVIYEGPALENNEMDVRDLAPALLAISDVLDEANKITYGDKTKVQINVRGSFKTGSFGIDFSLIQTGIEGFTSLFNSEKANATANLLQILGFIGAPSTFGLIGLLLKLRNRKIRKVIKEGDNKTVIEVEDEKIETSPKVITLFSNVKIRIGLQKIITEPLSREGVEKFSVRKDKQLTIKKEEKDYFKLSDIPDEPLKDQVREVYLKALAVIFVEGNKWKFSDGTNEFFATVKDEKFVKDVQANKISFTKDDTFKVKLREKQWITDIGLKTEHEIEEVISHRSVAKQISLPFEKE